jgi:hypothetical protein
MDVLSDYGEIELPFRNSIERDACQILLGWLFKSEEISPRT